MQLILVSLCRDNNNNTSSKGKSQNQWILLRAVAITAWTLVGALDANNFKTAICLQKESNQGDKLFSKVKSPSRGK